MWAAYAAGQSDPTANRQFSRRWEAPPEHLNRKGRPAQAAPSENQINGTSEYKAAEAAAQRACAFAARRAAALDHLADRCLQFGMGDTAERLSRTAWEIRAEVLV